MHDIFTDLEFNHRTFNEIDDKNRLMREYVRYMLDRTQEIFVYDGLPDTIPQRNLELIIQTRGYAGIIEYDGNLYALIGGRGGEPNVYYEPTKFVWANPALNASGENTIDVDCAIIRNDAIYMGLMPLCTRYASLLVENAITLRIADINLRSMLNITAPDDRSKASADQYLQQLERGKLSSMGSSEFFEGIKFHDGTHPASHMKDIIEYEQYLKASWFNELGLDANYNMKRERISESEVNQNSDALIPFVQNMLNSRRDSLEVVNRIFGTNITVDFNSIWKTNIEESLNEDLEDPDDDSLYSRIEDDYNTLIGGNDNES